MSSRHTRRKLARERNLRKLEGLAKAERSRRIAETVKANKSKPIERNYYAPVSVLGKAAEFSHRAYVCRNAKSLDFLPKGTVAHGFNRG